MDSNGVKAITSWDEENGYRKIIYNRDPILYIEASGTGQTNLNGEMVDLVEGSNYFEINEITDDSRFSNSIIKTLIIRCKLPSKLLNILMGNKSTHVELSIDDNVNDLSYIFNRRKDLEYTNASDWDTSNVTNMHGAFGMYWSETIPSISLTSLDVSKWDTSKVTDMGCLFQYCDGLTSLDTSKWDTSNVTNMSCLFDGCQLIESHNVSNWNTSKVTDMSSVFDSNVSLTTLDLSNWNTSSVINMSGMFSACIGLKEIKGISNWDTSNVEEMGWMFNINQSLESLDVSNFNTSKVTNMAYMFSNCTSLESLDVSNFNTSKVTNMAGIFCESTGLKEIKGISNWDTSNVTGNGFIGVFNTCSSLTHLDLSKWNTSKATDLSFMFKYCYELQSLDLSGWDVSNVGGYGWFFNSCRKLTSLKFPGFGKLLGSGGDFFVHAPLDHDSLMSIFTYDRTSAGMSAFRVSLSTTSKGYLTEAEVAEITAKGYTIS